MTIKGKQIRVGLVQMKCIPGDLEQNKKTIFQHLEQASRENVDIVCLPEMSTTGYNLNLLGDDIYDLSLRLDDDYIVDFQDFADDNSINLILPLSLKNKENKIYNSALVINRQGKIIGRYDKTHLFLDEQRYYQAGNSYQIFELEGFKFAILICYDLGFPEAARIMALKGAKVLFVPAAWRIQDIEIWDLNTRQRAQENNYFICGVNRVGSEEELYLFGGSRVVDPRGNVIAQADSGVEEVLCCDIKLELVEQARNYYQYLKARRKPLDSLSSED